MSIAALLASLAVFAPMPAGIHVVKQPCPYGGEGSCAYSNTVYLDPGMTHNGRLATMAILAHEIGHIWDAQHMDDTARARYASMLGYAGEPWLLDSNDDLDHPAAGEQFADNYALCALGPARRRRFRQGRHHYFGPAYGAVVPRQAVANTCWALRHWSTP